MTPFLNVNVGFLIQVADRAGRHLCSPQSLRDVLNAAHGNTGKIHLNEGFLDRGFTAFVALDDGSLEAESLEFRDMKADIAGDGRKVCPER